MLHTFKTRLKHWLFHLPEQSTHSPVVKLLRLLRYPYALIRDLLQGQLNLHAMSLVYTTLLSVAPFLALAFSVLKGLGYDRDFEPLLFQFLEPIGEKAHELTGRIMGFVANARGGVLGSLGLAFLLYTAISIIEKVEASFNFIWHIEQRRSWTQRFGEYASVMIVGPVLITAALGLIAAFSNTQLVHAMTRLQPLGNWFAWAGQIVPYILVSAVFTFLYVFIPNTTVKLRAALAGGIFAGFVWAMSGVLFARFVASSGQTTLIYAGFAIFIVALIWVYISWLVLLLGAQLCFYVQQPHWLAHGRRNIQLTASARERLSLAVMYLIAQDFKHPKHHWTVNRLAEYLNIPSNVLSSILEALENHGLLLNTHQDHLVPGRDLATIQLADILSAVRNDPIQLDLPKIRRIAATEQLATTLETALKASLHERTLADLIEHPAGNAE